MTYIGPHAGEIDWKMKTFGMSDSEKLFEMVSNPYWLESSYQRYKINESIKKYTLDETKRYLEDLYNLTKNLKHDLNEIKTQSNMKWIEIKKNNETIKNIIYILDSNKNKLSEDILKYIKNLLFIIKKHSQILKNMQNAANKFSKEQMNNIIQDYHSIGLNSALELNNEKFKNFVNEIRNEDKLRKYIEKKYKLIKENMNKIKDYLSKLIGFMRFNYPNAFKILEYKGLNKILDDNIEYYRKNN